MRPRSASTAWCSCPRRAASTTSPCRARCVQLAQDGARETPRMARVAVPDYLRFGPVSALRLFHQLTRFPSLERLQHAPGADAGGARQP